MLDAHDSTYPPLISHSSPSYERAWHEFAQPVAGGSAESVALLARLSEAEQNASQACLRAAQIVTTGPLGPTLLEHADIHEGRRAALAKLIEKLGGSAPTVAECRLILPAGSDALDRADSARSAVDALKLMRDELSAEYSAAIDGDQLDAAQRGALAGLAPERR
jgi:hypothetical protein